MSKSFRRHPVLKKLGDKWRKPKGDQNKSRQKLKGKNLMPAIGRRGARAGRGLHPSGLREILVNNMRDLEGVEGAAVRIASSVGKRKREMMMSFAEKKKLAVLNAQAPKAGGKT